jgi:predicted  nucleic acid-binding Zn-ribbon protein
MSLYCPSCFSEYRESLDSCPDCGVKLVSFDDLPLHCSSCGAVYPKGITRCPDCRKPLVTYKSADNLREGTPEYLDAEAVVVHETSHLPELVLIKGALEAAHIPYNAKGEELQSLFGAGLLGGFNPVTGTVQIIVEKSRAEEAREIINDLFKGNENGPSKAEI